MEMVQRVVVPLRVLLASTFVALVLGQLFSLPGTFAHMAEESPEDAYLRWPLTVVAVLELVCVQVVIVCTWRLLTMVRDDRIFSERSLVWVDAIVGAIVAGWVLLLGVATYLASVSEDPEVPAFLAVMVLAGAVLGLLMVVMRALLQQAITLRTDMEAVI
jgi:peptidoglycan/LPS O-acetylase OafA/YrhL